jgi:hypothetical protein
MRYASIKTTPITNNKERNIDTIDVGFERLSDAE